MRHFFHKPYRWAILFTVLLLMSNTYVLLKAFVIPEKQLAIAATKTTTSNTATASTTDATKESTSKATITDTSYQSDDLSITLTTKRVEDTTVYVVDIQTNDSSHLLTALAENSYGRNIKETTSAIAEENQAILAINGDFYGFRSTGFVMRNGILYRDTANGDTDALVIDKNGDFSIINEQTTSAKNLTTAEQILSFGPALVEKGEVVVNQSSEVTQSMTSNPRTAIGQIGENHYVIIVSEGRTESSEGLSLYELAQEMQTAGATIAYNLDGGGSSTLYFNGKVVNQTVGGSQNSSEREVSDILYFK
ncbi:phosphodiester glycosidase family protein [Enterococcus camelliae]|uniref:Phosphodiester glycosidase family protein n=1 Tax=Enterococcus camelliae TaxID=453959 RepID=A0ABW5TMY1_9ENTE